MPSAARLAACVTLMLVFGAAAPLRASGPGQSLLRGAARAVARRAAGRVEAAWARDLRKHAARRVVRLAKPRTVFRYTTATEARSVHRSGLGPMTHMTSKGGAGRPMNGTTARRTLGLQRRPSARVTLQLPKNQPVKIGKVQGGGPGRGEMVSTRRVPPSALRRVVPIRK
jgi:hypothetical protein